MVGWRKMGTPTATENQGRLNLLQDHFLPEEWISRHHPIDDIEPDLKRDDAIRDARVKCIILLNSGYSHIEAALLTPGANVQDIAVSFYQSAYALGLNLCAGISMTERADKWGVERASISKGATKFCEGNALPPSFYMKKEEAKSSYCDARIESIKKCNRKKS